MEIFLILPLTNELQEVTSSCAALGISCKEDCECCGYDKAGTPIRCERRCKILGYKCYQNGQIGSMRISILLQ